MYRKSLLFLIILWGQITPGLAQAPYLTGTARVSLEPPTSVFSVAMAGYGLPREGRFSLAWQEVGKGPELVALTGHNGQLFAASSENSLYTADPSKVPLAWQRVGHANGANALASLNGNLYLLNQNHELWQTKTGKRKLTWKKIKQSASVTSLTSFQGKLYGITAQGEIVAGAPSKKSITWQKIGTAQHTVKSLTSDDQMLYALHPQDTIWSIQLMAGSLKWTQIARHNKETYTINAIDLASLSDRYYALAQDGKLYANTHSSEGSLTATVMAVKQGETTVVLLGVDLCGFDKTFIDAVKAEVYQKRKIPASAILVNASHTHFAPITQNWYSLGHFYDKPNAAYMQMVRKNMVQVIEQALDNLTPSYLSFGRSTSTLGQNRRLKANPAAPYDNTLDVLKIEDEKRIARSLLFLAACHPVFRNTGKETYTLSANFPGVARKLISQKTGLAHPLFLQGCGGDINPLDTRYEKTGTTLASDALAVFDQPLAPIFGGISHSLDSIHFPIKPWTVEELQAFKAKNSNANGDVYIEKNVRWADEMLTHHRNGTMPTSLPVYIQTINIGNWKLVGLSREAVNEYAPAIRKIWPDKFVSVAGYCNDVSSYLPHDWHIQTNVYEGNDSFFWYGQPGIFPQNTMELIINRISHLNK